MANTVDLIAQHEGFSATPYWDHSQWSIGYGSYAGSRSRSNPPNITITQAQGRDMLQQQLGRYEANVDSYDSTYNWTPAERQALTSFAYNVGSIDQLTDNGRRSRAEIVAAMPLYNKASQQVVPGLVRRRAEELAIFTGGTVPSTPGETRTPLTPAEQDAVRELQRARSNLDAVNADDNASPAERRLAQERFDEAKSNSPLTGRDGAVAGNSSTANNNNGPDGIDLSSAQSLAEIVTQYENAGKWIENPLDTYQNYTYHLELFIVNQKDAIDFLQSESANIDSIISNAWPGANINYITVAETGVTTEFNLQDLEIQSLGSGSSSSSRIAGTATSLSFSIAQVGNTNLNDHLINAALLSGFSSISEAKFFLKVNFKGYTDDGTVIVSEDKNLTKVFPIIIRNIADVGGGTDARGTITTLDCVIQQDYANSTSVSQIIHNFEFLIKPTLDETLADFFDKLNDNIKRTDFSTEDANNNPFVHEYEYVLDPEFAQKYAESSMNDEGPQTGSANNTVGNRTGGLNVSEQIGTVIPGLNIQNVLIDICIQSLDVRKALIEESDTFNDTLSIMPTAIPKPGGLNPLNGEAGHKVTYYITTTPRIIVQNNHDNANKIKNAGKLVKKIFDNNKCKKVYYHQFTGMNTQILDLTLSFNRQLMKSYNLPKDAAFQRHFLRGTDSISTDLNPRAQARLEVLQNELTALDVDRNTGVADLERIRDELENTSGTIGDSLVNSARNGLQSQGVDSGFTQQIIGDMAGKSLQEQIEIVRQHDPEFLQSEEFKEVQDKYNELIAQEAAAIEANNGTEQNASTIESNRDEVIAQAMGANFANFVNANLANTADNFRANTNAGNSNQVIMEELADDMISRMSTQQLEDIMEALLVNPIIFKRTILSTIMEKNSTVIFSSSNEEDISLARAKFYEAINMDISMQKLKLTIKGDPYWIDTYLTPSTAKELFGDTNLNEDRPNHPSTINGPNYVSIVVNKAAGVDEFDNTKIANLATMLYAVKNITSSFSGGEFTQQLDMIKVSMPDSFLPVSPFFATGNTAVYTQPDSFGFSPETNEVETPEVSPLKMPLPTLPTSIGRIPAPLNPDNFPIGPGSTVVDPDGNVGVLLDPDGAPIAINALTANTQLLLENDGVPTAEQANQYENNKAQVEYYCAQGSEAACVALQTSANTINNQIVNNIAGEPPYDNQQIVNDLNESGIEITPEGISIMQESMIAGGHEPFNADDIEGISQAEVDAFRQRKEDAAAAFYIGTNGIIENPQSVIQGVDTIDITSDPFVSKGSAVSVISNQTGQGLRSVVTEVPINTLTPIEFHKAQTIQSELRTKLQETPIQDMTEAEYAEVKELEGAVNNLVTSATTGERGELLNDYQEHERQEDISVLEAKEAELQEELDSWYWTNKGREEDEQSIADIREQLAEQRQDSIEAGFTDETEGE